jgi:hypothetical protein
LRPLFVHCKHFVAKTQVHHAVRAQAQTIRGERGADDPQLLTDLVSLGYQLFELFRALYLVETVGGHGVRAGPIRDYSVVVPIVPVVLVGTDQLKHAIGADLNQWCRVAALRVSSAKQGAAS